MENGILTTIVVAILGSGALSSMIQFFITLGFSRRDKSREIEKKIDLLSEKVDKNQAVNARSHLLRFADELRAGCVHSIEYYKQTLLDAKYYELYCAEHKDFSNGITEISIEYIKAKYREELENGNVEGG